MILGHAGSDAGQLLDVLLVALLLALLDSLGVADAHFHRSAHLVLVGVGLREVEVVLLGVAVKVVFVLVGHGIFTLLGGGVDEVRSWKELRTL